MDIRTERLRIAFEKSGLTQTELCEKAGINKGAFSSYLSGRYFPKQKALEKLSSVLGVSIKYLMGIDEAVYSAPLYEAAAGEGRVNDGFPSDTYSVRLESDEVVVQVSGRSMEPTLLDGDKVIVAAQSVIDYPRQIALVKVNGDNATLKRVEKKDNGLMLLADNVDVYSPHFYTVQEIAELPVTIEGVVTRLIREMK